MKHSIQELYKIMSAKAPILATASFIEAYGIPTTTAEVAQARLNGKRYALKATHQQSNKGYAKVYTANSIDLIWLYGEKTWFDTKEERDVYRASIKKEGV